jgi:Ca-activated chloride channel family protein
MRRFTPGALPHRSLYVGLFLFLLCCHSTFAGAAESNGASAKIKFVSPQRLTTVLGITTAELSVRVPQGAMLDRVEVLVDGNIVITLVEPPWSTEWDAGNAVHGHELEARLFLADGSVTTALTRTSALRINQVEGVGLVNLFAVVRDKSGDFVSDLDKQDFQIIENGTPQTIKKFSTLPKPVRVAIVIDTSRTMEGRRLAKARSAALEFLQALQPGDEAAIITFADDVKVIQPVTTDKTSLIASVEDTVAKGGTSLYDAVWRAADVLKGFDGRRVLVLLSDGRDESLSGLSPGSLHTLDEAIEQVHRAEGMIFAIGIGSNLNTDLDYYRTQTVASILREMARTTGGRALISGGAGELRSAFKDIASDLRNQYLIAYVSNDTHHDGRWREVRVLPSKDDHKVVTRSGYFAPDLRDEAEDPY